MKGWASRQHHRNLERVAVEYGKLRKTVGVYGEVASEFPSDPRVLMSKKTESGFPIGKVAQTLRKILDPKLTEHEVKTIVVLLMPPDLRGDKWRPLPLVDYDAPSPPAKRQKLSQTENKLRDVIPNMSVHNKLFATQALLRYRLRAGGKQCGTNKQVAECCVSSPRNR